MEAGNGNAGGPVKPALASVKSVKISKLSVASVESAEASAQHNRLPRSKLQVNLAKNGKQHVKPSS